MTEIQFKKTKKSELDRWRKGERGPSLENQQLMPGDCLVL